MASKNRGRGMWKGKVNLYPGWDAPEEDKKIEEMFEFLQEESGETPSPPPAPGVPVAT